ncbi:unnamed protein product [Discula destructiva]
MATARGKAAFKKKDGIIAVSDDLTSVTWTALPATGSPTISLNISDITNLQQTPLSNPKAILKIFAKSSTSAGDGADTYMFHFNSQDTARAEADAVKDLLSRLLNDAKAGDPSLPRPAHGPPATNGSTNPASSSNAANDARLFDDEYLVSDFALHTALLEANKPLNAVYLDAMANKPDTIPKSVFSKHFWSTRVGLLRTFAIEKRQTRGAYNVLPTMKPKVTQDEDGVEHTLMSIDRSQALQIFSQHPVVKRAYNENVPKPLSETDFWSKFFLSRLCKQLKGDRVVDSDRRDPIFDKYDAAEDQIKYASRLDAAHFPKTIDVEGNEENTGGVKSGNSKDIEMRPRKNVPIIQVLNATSGNLLSNVAATDRHSEDTSGTDDATWRELTLRDLGDKAEDTRIMLNIKQQNQFFLDQTAASSAPDRVYEKQVPSEVLEAVSADLKNLKFTTAGGVDLHASLGVVDESEYVEDDEDGPKKSHVGSKSAMRVAQEQIFEGLAQSRAEFYSHNSDETKPMGITQELTEKAKLTSGTTTEFLTHFWDAFLSGDPNRAQELSYHVESLKRSAMRIEAMADEAEQARITMASEQRAKYIAHKQATGQRFAVKEIGGGREAMLTLLGSSLSALQRALNLYEAALAQEGMRMSTEDD